MSEWRKVKIGDFLSQYRITHIVQDEQYYGQITISKNNTIRFREKNIGKDIGRKRQFIIDLKQYPKTLIFTRQGVLDGSIGIAPAEVDGCIATENMPMFSINDKVIHPELLLYLIRSDIFKQKVKTIMPTGSAQKAIHERELLELNFFLPSKITHQQKLLNTLKKYDEIISPLFEEEHLNLQRITKLRQAILQEAIEGKLTADWRVKNPVCLGDPNTDAHALLENIKAEKQRLINEGKIKKDKPLAPIKPDEIPFDLPAGWVWVRLGGICESITKGTTPATTELKNTGEIPYLKVYNVVNQKINFYYKPQYISKEIHNQLQRSKVYPSDVLMNIVGPPLGKIAIVPNDFEEWNINQALAIFRSVIRSINRFIYLFLNEGSAIKAIQTLGVVGQDNISLAQCRDIVFPLPPLAEQQAIVERVDRLLNQVNALEQQVKERKSYAEQLMQAVLREAFQA